MIFDKRDIGGYYGIYREIVFTQNNRFVVIRFNALGNDQIDLEFLKEYDNSSQALNSIEKYVKETKEPLKEERGPREYENWKDFENSVNESIIQLFKDAVNEEILLPDFGLGYILNKPTYSDLEESISTHNKGELPRFVVYNF